MVVTLVEIVLFHRRAQKKLIEKRQRADLKDEGLKEKAQWRSPSKRVHLTKSYALPYLE